MNPNPNNWTQKRKRKNPKTGKKKEKAKHTHWDGRWQYKWWPCVLAQCLCCAALASCRSYLAVYFIFL